MPFKGLGAEKLRLKFFEAIVKPLLKVQYSHLHLQPTNTQPELSRFLGKIPPSALK